MNNLIFSFFDTETTGFDPYWDGHRVIQAAVLRTRGGEVIDTFDSLVNPGRAIPGETIAIHGITEEMVEFAPTFDVVLPPLLDMLRGTMVVIHNAPFDLAFLDQAIREYGLNPEELTIVDTLEIARRHLRFPGNALRKISRYYGIESPLPHRATYDVEILRQVFDRFVEELELETVDDLMALSGVYRTTIGEQATPPDFWQAAIDSSASVTITYQSRTGSTERVIEPVGYQERSGRQYLIAFCRLRNERRTFRLDRIRVISS